MRVGIITLFVGFALWIAPSAVLAQDAPAENMMGMMGQMKAHHQDMDAIMKELMKSMAAIQAEKDASALKSRIADQAALMEQMRAKMAQASDMMKKMSGMGMSMIPGMADGAKKAEPEPKPDAAPNEADHSTHQH